MKQFFFGFFFVFHEAFFLPFLLNDDFKSVRVVAFIILADFKKYKVSALAGRGKEGGWLQADLRKITEKGVKCLGPLWLFKSTRGNIIVFR